MVANGLYQTYGDFSYQDRQRSILRDEYWDNRRVIVTVGGTIEKIDEVRYISNFSSGKMANALATALYLKGLMSV